MTSEQKAAYIYSQSVSAMIEAMGMVAANQERTANGYTIAYDEGAFQSVIARHCLGYNDVMRFLNG